MPASLPDFTPVWRCDDEVGPRLSIPQAVAAALAPGCSTLRGRRVAVAVGSRAIDRLSEVVGALIAHLRDRGMRVSIVPAMGSHGGGTPGGRRRVLAGLGLLHGASSSLLMDDDQFVHSAPGLPVAAAAVHSDALVLVNRVKEHTVLTGAWGSGLRKMAVVGLGGPDGARRAHREGLQEALPARYACVAAALPPTWGLALLEDGRGRLRSVEGSGLPDFGRLDERLLAQARKLALNLPPLHLDALVVARMGKDISGTGMDPAVTGRQRRTGLPGPGPAGWLGVCRLSEASGGNGMGVGMADAVTAALTRAIDAEVTAANARASGWCEGARTPAHVAATETALLQAACARGPRVVILRDTRHLDRFLATADVARDLAGERGCFRLGEPMSLPLTATADVAWDRLPL